ncbi:hypothetical protein SB783_42765, partial [Paraburkholderia sp. SIMBA_009]
LERTEDYRDPKIHHFLKTLLRQLHLLRVGRAKPNGRRTREPRNVSARFSAVSALLPQASNSTAESIQTLE